MQQAVSDRISSVCEIRHAIIFTALFPLSVIADFSTRISRTWLDCHFIYKMRREFSFRMPENGLLTSADRKWLSGEQKNKSKRKLECQRRLAMALQDIEEICNVDGDAVSNLDHFGELFDLIEEDKMGGTDFDRQEAAKYLIAVAYKLVNSSIDYATISKETELKSGGSLGRIQPTDDLLAFRRAMADGIKIGREDLEAHDGEKYIDNDDIPERVIINSNTRLYEPPTIGDLSGFEAKHFREGNRQRQDATNIPDDEVLDPSEIKQEMAVQIDLAVSQEISRRQATADEGKMDRLL